MVSRTVTVALQLAVLLLASVTVKVTVLGPRFKQVKFELLSVAVGVPQLSVEPLLIAAAEVETAPSEFRNTVRFWQTAVGGVTSFTVTVKLQVEVLPDPSFAMKLLVVVPTGNCEFWGKPAV